MKIEWVNDRPNEGYAGTIRVTVWEAIPRVSWKVQVEALVQVPGSSYLRPSGHVLTEMGPTEAGIRAAAVLLCQRILCEVAA